MNGGDGLLTGRECCGVKLRLKDEQKILELLFKFLLKTFQVVTECDNGVRKMKQIEELVCLEMLMDFGKVKVMNDFIFHAVRLLTVFLTALNLLRNLQMAMNSNLAASSSVQLVPLVVSRRFLVHHGPVRQLTVEAGAYNSRVSFIRVYLHIFNDLLIISLKK